MKKLISLIITLSTVLSCIIPIYADSEITVNLNGEKITFDQPPIIQNDRTLVPMRAIFEALGCIVFWDEEDQSVEAWQAGVYIMTLWVNDYNMKLGNSDYITLDVPPTIINDRTLVPLRAISESMGADVNWDGRTRTVDIYYSRTSYYPQAECEHTNTTDATLIDVKDYENTGSATTHKVINFIDTVCDDCGQLLNTTQREKEEPHNFVNNVCDDCGYEKQSNCSHSNTKEVISIDARECANTGSSTIHKVTDEVIIYCNDCNEQVDTQYKTSEKSHNFENGVCVDCGYGLGQTTQTEDYIELRNANLLDQDSSHPASNCTWTNTNNLMFHLVTAKNNDYGLNPGDETNLWVEYDLDGQYSELTAIIKGSAWPSYMKIYVDDNLVVQTEQMGSSSKKDIKLDLVGAKTLKIETYSTVGKVAMESGSYKKIYLDDAKLWY